MRRPPGAPKPAVGRTMTPRVVRARSIAAARSSPTSTNTKLASDGSGSMPRARRPSAMRARSVRTSPILRGNSTSASDSDARAAACATAFTSKALRTGARASARPGGPAIQPTRSPASPNALLKVRMTTRYRPSRSSAVPSWLPAGRYSKYASSSTGSTCGGRASRKSISASLSTTPPVGLLGLTTATILVRGPMAPATASRSYEPSGRSATGVQVAPSAMAPWRYEMNDGHPITSSSPGSSSAMHSSLMRLSMPLPTMMRSGSMPWRSPSASRRAQAPGSG